jgi:hypothetical protein
MAVKKPLKKGGQMERRRLVADIHEPVYRALKMRSAETDEEMRDIVEEALRKHLGIKEGGESERKS